MAFSTDLRERVLADFKEGLCFAQLSRKYRVSAEWARTFIRRYEETGEIDARSHRNHRQSFATRHEILLRQAIQDNPSHTLESLREHLKLEVSLPTLWLALKTLKLSFKKNTYSR